MSERPERIYLSHQNGLKEARLQDAQIDDPEATERECRELLCKNLIDTKPESVHFAQNMTTHLAYIASIAHERSNIQTIVLTDHEIDWMKDMFDDVQSTPDATFSNYRSNEPIRRPFLRTRVIDFNDFSSQVAAEKEPALFLASHVSRLTGETLDIAAVHRSIKQQNPASIFIVDAAQSLGVLPKVDVNASCDVYLAPSSKFLGAEPHLGIAALSSTFTERFLRDNAYPPFDARTHARDLLSLAQQLRDPRYQGNFTSRIESIRSYALQQFPREIIFAPEHQSAGFITLDIGATEAFVRFAAIRGIVLSDNTSFSMKKDMRPLIRIGISAQTNREDIDRLVEVVKEFRR